MRKRGSSGSFRCPTLEVGGGEAREPVLSQTPRLAGEWKDTLCLEMPRGAHVQKTKAQTRKRGEGNPREPKETEARTPAGQRPDPTGDAGSLREAGQSHRRDAQRRARTRASQKSSPGKRKRSLVYVAPRGQCLHKTIGAPSSHSFRPKS